MKIIVLNMNADICGKLYLVVDKLVSFYRVNNESYTTINVIDDYYKVRETPEEILNLLGGNQVGMTRINDVEVYFLLEERGRPA